MKYKTALQRMLSITALIAMTFLMTACDTQDVPPGHKGFMFDKTGTLALYTGGEGLQTDTVLGSGTHYTGYYDEVIGVNCQDAHVKDQLQVLTKSDMKVTIDIRVTYAADCDSAESLAKIIEQVPRRGENPYVQPPAVFEKYVMPSIREALRNELAGVTIEEVKGVRGDLATAIRDEVNASIKEKKFPVRIDLLAVSDITLPEAITAKIKEIEVARMEANKEQEKQRAAKVRLERELFEAEQEREVATQRSLKAKEIKEMDAKADLEVRKLEAQGIAELRKQLTPQYLEFLRLEKEAEVQKKMAESMGQGSVYYLGDKDFMLAPGTHSSVSLPANR